MDERPRMVERVAIFEAPQISQSPTLSPILALGPRSSTFTLPAIEV